MKYKANRLDFRISLDMGPGYTINKEDVSFRLTRGSIMGCERTPKKLFGAFEFARALISFLRLRPVDPHGRGAPRDFFPRFPAYPECVPGDPANFCARLFLYRRVCSARQTRGNLKRRRPFDSVLRGASA